MPDDAAERMALADETLEEARALFRAGFYKASVHAYCAAFHAAMALLAREGKRPKTHKGVIAELGRDFVETGRLPEDAGAHLEQLLAMRLKADYEVPVSITDERAEESLVAAERFVQAARKALES